MKKNKQKNNGILVATNILFIIVIVVLIFIVIGKPKEINNINITHDNASPFVLTSPILDCEINNELGSSVIFSKDIDNKIGEIKKENSLEYISLYFRDLNGGSWVGINEKETFSPASLLKVPIFMALLKDAEETPSILDKKVMIIPDDISKESSQNIVFADPLVAGQEYSLLDISKHMIEKSDNAAIPALLRNINQDNVASVFKSVGVPFVDLYTEVNITVKDYAGFFRVLYNASYLNRSNSEMALDVLSKTEYNSGIVAGVPKGITISHKFGERRIEGESNNIQLHDCGIVYYPQKPYILCIMTRGNDISIQEKSIKDLSAYVYSKVNENSN